MADRVTLYIEGLMLEKLVMRALEQGATIADMRRLSRRELIVTAEEKSAKIVRNLAEKYSMRCEVRSKTGRAAYRSYLRARATLPAAFLLLFALSALYLSRIWIVKVRVLNGAAATGAVYLTLAEHGAVEGARASEIDPEVLALTLTSIEGYSYASVSREGICLVVELAAERPAPELYDLAYARDLVASCDAVIVSVNVKAGTAQVKAGDTVRKGQVLISGAERVSKEDTHSVGALGSVIARVWCEGKARGNTTEVVKDFTGRESTSSRVALFHWSVDLTKGEEYECAEKSTEYLPVGGLFVPLRIERATAREYLPRTSQKDENALRATLLEAAYAKAYEEMNARGFQDAEMIDKWQNSV